MKKSVFLFALLAAGCAATPQLATPPAVAPQPTPAPSQWVQLGEGGAAELRAVVGRSGSECPQFHASNGQVIALKPRAASDDKFDLVCSAPLPAGAVIPGVPAVKAAPERIVIVGDTGC